MSASAAAPTYFDEFYVRPANGHLIGWCQDGGVALLANPVLQLALEAFRYGTFDPLNTRILSIGTGFYPVTPVNPPSGLLNTITETIDCMLDVAEDRETYLTRLLYPNTPLVTLNAQMPRAVDMADLTARDLLLEVGTKAAAQIDWAVVSGLTKN
jgi:hypothetical protein